MSIPMHVSRERDPGARGFGLGRALCDTVTRNLELYERLFAATAGVSAEEAAGHGATALRRVEEWAPSLAQEIRGIAAGAGVAVERVAALNARTEILALGHAPARGECSTVACLGSASSTGEPWGVQTWDWHEELAGAWLVWSIETEERTVHTLTEAGIVGKIGLSSAGVGVHLNILRHAADRAPAGVPVHVACRRVLDEARDGNEALRLLAAAPVSASSAMTVVAGDQDGGTVCTVEVSPAGPSFVLPDERGLVAHTNHFLAEPGRAGDLGPRDAPDTLLRLDHVRRSLRLLGDAPLDDRDVLQAMGSHRGGAGAVCCHPAPDAVFGERWRTLATICLEPAAGRMTVRRGGPCAGAEPYVFSTTAAAARQSASRQGLAAS